LKVLRVIAAIVLAALLLYIARVNSKGRPRFISHTENDFTFEMNTVPKAYEDSQVRIPIKITGNIEPNLRLLFRPSKYGQDETTELRRYQNVPLLVEDSTAGLYYAEAPTGAKGQRLYYYFEIRDNTGGYRAGFKQADGTPFVLKYKGHVPTFILSSHVALMALTVFFLFMGFLHAIPVIRGSHNPRPMALYFFLTALCAFLGGYPIGFAMNHYDFGTIWEGVPFGTDATDNKTQLLFAYLLFMTAASIGSLSRGRLGRDIYPPVALGWFGIGAFGLMLAIYLIPHSIQFTPELTRAVCYSFLGVVALLYAVGWILTRFARSRANRSAKGKQRK
jgi:hypothetical protein